MKSFFRSIFFSLIFVALVSTNFCVVKKNCFASNYITFCCEESVFCFSEVDLGSAFFGKENEMLTKVKSLGFSEEQAVKYVFKKIESVYKELKNKLDKKPQEATIDCLDGCAKIVGEKNGKCLNENQFYKALFNSICSNINNVELKLEELTPNRWCQNIYDYTNTKADFTTYIKGVNQEGRIHNIKLALDKFNGFVVLPNEVVSFNKVVGDTTKENGFSLAKVILNGKYVEDYGGGVCQAATTLYNALLVSGMDILKVRPHSLKVGYVLGAFDAMVSMGVSDLVFKNSTNSPIFIHTNTTDTECNVKIFGSLNEYTIVRRSEQKEFDSETEPTVNCMFDGFLDFYKDDILIKSQKIRSDKYFNLTTD